ncbi:hypothetical protein LL946_01265 [Knoellia locipacati]|uniref:nSTAND1 domain-containing NTPase n=1 Tax=Knoellia locipacati TaxID=882824 RepID=UPI00384DADE9
MGIGVLGPLLVDDHAAFSPRDQVVLEALVAAGGTALSAESLAEALWGEEPPPSWKKLVPSSILRLRQRLGHGAIETTSHGYRLSLNGDSVDSVRFVHLVERGHQLLTSGDADRARHVLREALGLWRGRALAEIADWEPGRFEAERLDEVRREAEEAVLDASLRAGLHAESVAEARTRVAQEPLRERRWALLALAQYLSGDQGDALTTLREARRRLADELGLDPSAELARLEDAILRQDASLVAAVALPEPAPECPYPGLRAFEVEDGEVFFGRTTELEQCLSRLMEQGVLVVAGPSGSGKSSLVRAGVVASLRRSHRPVEILGPGPDGLIGMRQLVESGWRGAVVVDQLEEVLAAGGPEARNELVADLVRHAAAGPLIMTLRADHLEDVSRHPELSRIVERGLYLLGPLTEESLRAAIEGPAAEAALVLEPGVVDVLLNEVLDAPGALPLMAHVLEQTWQRREGRTLTLAGYRASGGIEGAVAQSAEGVFDSLDVDDRDVLRDLLRRLVSVTPDGDPVRVWVPVRRLPEDGSRGLVDLLVRARLLAVDEGVVAVAHESLARAWPRLRAWLEEDVEGQHILRHLSAAADSWDGLDRPQSELYRGIRLTRALGWQARSTDALTPTESAFLSASEEVDRAAREQEALAEMSRRRHGRTTRALVAGLVALVVVAVTTAGVAVLQRGRAAEAAVGQRASAAAAAARESADPTVAMLAGVEAVRLRDAPETRGALLAALTRWPSLLATRVVDDAKDIDVAASGRVVLGRDSALTAIDPDSLADEASQFGSASRVDLVTDGRTAVTASDGGEVELIDLESGDRQQLRPPSRGQSWGPRASADGEVVVAAVTGVDDGNGSAVFAWRGTTLLATIAPQEITDLALSRDGNRLYLHLPEPVATIAVHDVATGRRIASAPLRGLDRVLPAQSGVVEPMVISPDGRLLALGGAEVTLIDTSDLTVQRRLEGSDGETRSLAFSHDGRLLAGGSDESSVAVWDIRTQRIERLEALSEAVNKVAFSSDAGTLYTLTNDHRLSSWDLTGDRSALQRVHSGLGPGLVGGELVVPAPTGDVVAFMSPTPGASDRHDTIAFLDVAAGRLLEPVEGEYQNWGVWRPPSDDQLAVPGDRSIRVWDWSSRSTVLDEEVGQAAIEALAYTPDGRRLIVGERAGYVYEVDADTLAPTGPRARLVGDLHEVISAGADRALAILGTRDGIASTLVDLRTGRTSGTRLLSVDVGHAEVSPDGRLLALGGFRGEVGILDLATGAWVKEPVAGEHQGFILRVDFSSDGALLVSSGQDGRVRLWDGRTGAKRESIRVGRVDVPSSAIFEQDGRTLFLAAGDGSVQRWDTSVSSWVGHACRTAGRNLTPEEWDVLFGTTATYHAGCSADQLRR